MTEKYIEKKCVKKLDRIAIDRALEMTHSHDCDKHNDKLSCESQDRASARAVRLIREVEEGDC